MYPTQGEIGSIKAIMYRGIKPATDRVNDDYASDPGDYGRGEYWTDDESFAKIYGDVTTRVIELDCVYHIPNEELRTLTKEYRTCKIEDGPEIRLKNVLRLTEHFKSKGYKAVLTSGYETFTTKGLCIFA